MFYGNELTFLRDTFKKRRITTTVTSMSAPFHIILNEKLSHFMDEDFWNAPLKQYICGLETHTIYQYKDPLGLGYMILLLPQTKEDALIIGPYSYIPITKEIAFERMESAHIPVKHRAFWEEYLTSIPQLEEESPLFAMLDTFAECIWRGETYSFLDREKELSIPGFLFGKVKEDAEIEDNLATIKRMELRYEYENELMQAVSLGQSQKATLLLSTLATLSVDNRTSDRLRNLKNYCVIMNTLLRKAAEKGGVHPVYLDRVSTAFALSIEGTTAQEEIAPLMTKMFGDYCRLVRKHSLGEYSPIVQKTIIFIESDLSAELSLQTLATAQKVSPGYLSAVFKKETGKTLTEYITRKRMKHAAHLLTTTHLQVQTIALHCGIMDVQYFSKLFKRYMGMSPGEYRQSHL